MVRIKISGVFLVEKFSLILYNILKFIKLKKRKIIRRGEYYQDRRKYN